MMDFISVPLVVGIVCAGIYGLFELFCSQEGTFGDYREDR